MWDISKIFSFFVESGKTRHEIGFIILLCGQKYSFGLLKYTVYAQMNALDLIINNLLFYLIKLRPSGGLSN